MPAGLKVKKDKDKKAVAAKKDAKKKDLKGCCILLLLPLLLAYTTATGHLLSASDAFTLATCVFVYGFEMFFFYVFSRPY